MSKTFHLKGKKYNCIKNGVPYFRKTAVINGKQRSFYGDGEKDALRKIEEAKALVQQGFDFDKRTAKTDEVFRSWLFDVKRVDRNIKDSTFSAYERQYRKFISDQPLGRTTLSKLTSSVLQRCLNEQYESGNASGKNIGYFMTLFKQFCKWAVNEGFLTKNPSTNIVIPGERVKGKKTIETFTEEERRTLLLYMEESGYIYDDLIKLAFATGMRKGELLALRWDDIDGNVIHVKQTKVEYDHIGPDGSKERRQMVWDTKTAAGTRDIPLLDETAKMLAELHHKQKLFCFKNKLPQSKYVFINKNGNLIAASNLDESYRRLLERAGIPYKKFHTIRHTFATEAIRRGVPVKDLQMLMGHTDIATTYIYVHANESTKREAIELMGKMM